MDSSDEAGPDWFRDALAHEAERFTTDANGCEVVYRRWGDPELPAIVLVHGSSAHSHWWDHVAPFLVGDRSVVALDLSGNGDSGRRSAYGWDAWAQDVLAVTREVARSGPPIVVAHSLGGRISVRAARQEGSEWLGLILLDSAPGGLRAGGDSPPRPESAPRVPVYPTLEDAVARFRLRPSQPNSLSFVVNHIARHSLRPEGDGWTWKTDPVTRVYSGQVGVDELAQVECPIAVVRAEHGRLVADAGIQLEKALRRAVPTVLIPTAHHHLMVDQPIAMVTAIGGLLETWPPFRIASRGSA